MDKYLTDEKDTMDIKQPSFYRDLLESILNEMVFEPFKGDWKDCVELGYHDDSSINASVNIPIKINGQDAVVTGVEIPLDPNFRGLIGIYFRDEDYDTLDGLDGPGDGDDEADSAISGIVGEILGRNVRLTKGQDFLEPLNGGDTPGARYRLPPSLISSLSTELRSDEKGMVRALLKLVKKGSFDTAKGIISDLRSEGKQWPELNTIEKSISSK